jgi:aldehyde dehydrogenase
VTGGPAVARAALQSPKRAIVAGPGNPPVVVDETADLDNAARSIIAGAAYDNNLLCIGEKQVFVVASVFDRMMAAMEKAGALRLSAQQVDALTKRAIVMSGEGAHRHWVPCKDLLGKDASLLAQAAGASARDGLELVFGETDVDNPFVPTEQMMPFLPFVRCKDVDEAIQRAHESEHGFRHTAIIHSNNVRTMTRMGRLLDTTLFIKNGPSVAGLGLGGEGYLSFSIATPTGEGVTTPLTFTRQRRCTLVKHKSLDGSKLHVVQPLMADRATADGDPQLAIDTVAASVGDIVMITSDGRLLREVLRTDATPARWSTIALIDEPGRTWKASSR